MPRVRSVSMNSFIGVARFGLWHEADSPLLHLPQAFRYQAASPVQFVGVCG